MLGRRRTGQLGNDALPSSDGPLPVVGLTDAVAVSARIATTWALRWGRSCFGQLGVGNTAASSSPVGARPATTTIERA